MTGLSWTWLALTLVILFLAFRHMRRSMNRFWSSVFALIWAAVWPALLLCWIVGLVMEYVPLIPAILRRPH